jgi:broad-specificity NMP kinase
MGVYYSSPSRHQRKCIANIHIAISQVHINLDISPDREGRTRALFETMFECLHLLEYFHIYKDKDERRKEMIQEANKLQFVLIQSIQRATGILYSIYTTICDLWITVLGLMQQFLAEKIAHHQYSMIYETLDHLRSEMQASVTTYRSRNENSVLLASVVQ